MPRIPDFYCKSLPDSGEFSTSHGLLKKVDEGGYLRPFSGETTVFLLPEKVKEHLGQLQSKIYSAAGEMLCRIRLTHSSFHMTLHDLWNVSDERQKPTYSHEQLREVLASIRRDFTEPIPMRAISLLNMVNTSVVLGLVPADDEAESALAEMYSRLQALWPLPYGLTPHITLAYYRPGIYPEQLWQQLGRAFAIERFEFSISTQSLVFQRFEDMNSYIDL